MSLDDIRELGEVSEDEHVYLREHVFVVRYHDPDGKKHEASLVSNIMDGDERNKVARIAAQIASCAWDSLPPGEQLRIYGLAVCSVQLRNPPMWVSKWITEDPALLAGIYEEVARHDAGWFRSSSRAGDSDSSQARVQVSSESPAPPAAQQSEPLIAKPMHR